MTTSLPSMPYGSDPSTSERDEARRRLERRRRFRGDVFAFVVVNLFLVAAWAVTGAGYFWPAWVMAGWAVLLLIDGWAHLRPPSDQRGGRRRRGCSAAAAEP